MVTVIKQGSPTKQLNELLQKLFEKKRRKGIDTQKYCGVLKLEKDALVIQKQLRDEW